MSQLISNTIMNQVFIPWFCFLLYKEIPIIYKSYQIISSRKYILTIVIQSFKMQIFSCKHIFLKEAS